MKETEEIFRNAINTLQKKIDITTDRRKINKLLVMKFEFQRRLDRMK